MLQPLADGVKFLFKEDLTPPHVHKPLYIAAPMIAVVFALTSIAVVPVGNWVVIGGLHIPLQITDVNIGLLIVLGITSPSGCTLQATIPPFCMALPENWVSPPLGVN